MSVSTSLKPLPRRTPGAAMDEYDSYEGHLDTCPSCPAELDWLERLVHALKTDDPEEM